MNEVEKLLYKTRKTLPEACAEAAADINSVVIEHLQECTSCGIWEKHSRIVPDLDENPICKECLTFYGM